MRKYNIINLSLASIAVSSSFAAAGTPIVATSPGVHDDKQHDRLRESHHYEGQAIPPMHRNHAIPSRVLNKGF